MAEPNQLYNFGRVHHKGQFCEIIVHFGHLVHSKTFLNWSFGRSIVQWSRNICAKLVEETIGVRGKFCEINLLLGQWFKRKFCLKKFLS